MVSPPTSFALGMASRTRACNTGSMLARNRNSEVQILSGQLRLKAGEHVQVGLQRLGLVDVVAVLALPEERLAFGALNAARIHAALVHHGFVLGQEVVAHHANHAHVGEIAGGERKIRGSAAQHFFANTVRGLQAIECNRTNNDDGQDRLLFVFVLEILSDDEFQALQRGRRHLVFVVMMACFNAEPQVQTRSLGIAATASRTTLLAFSAFFTSTPMICSTVTWS